MKTRLGFLLACLATISCGDDGAVFASTETGSSGSTGADGGPGLPPPDGGPGPDDGVDVTGSGDDTSGSSGMPAADSTSSGEPPADSSSSGEPPADSSSTTDATTTDATTTDATTTDATTTDATTTDTGTTTGDPPECTIDDDCVPASICQTGTCDAGTCVFEDIIGDAPQQTLNDCQVTVCQAGQPVDQVDDTDLPVDDGDPCTLEVCDAGVPGSDPAPAGEPCGIDGVCDGAGQCVGCTTAADCTDLPPDDDCQTRTCTAGVCGQDFAPQGTALTLQTDGDCQTAVCDGAGGTTSVDDDTDPLVDGLECTDDLCDAGTPDNPPVAEGTACAAGLCNAVGECVGCLVADDCAGSDTFCQTIVCTPAGVCDVDNTPAGTAVPQQVLSDCQLVVCDGNGLEQGIADDTDVPPDDGTGCSTAGCVMGVPTFTPQPAGSLCGNPLATQCTGADSCDGNGACLPNNAASGAPCGDQGVACLVDDACDGNGGCTDNGQAAEGSACGDGNDTECTNPDSCDAVGVCVSNDAAAGAPCGDQNVECTLDDACDGGGTCIDAGFENAGTACGDATDTDCTDPDACDGTGTCLPNDAVATTPCTDDGELCTGDEICDGIGGCTSEGDPCAPAQVCDDSGTCDAVCNLPTDVLWCFQDAAGVFVTTTTLGTGTFSYGFGVSNQGNVTGNAGPAECVGTTRAATGTGWTSLDAVTAAIADDCYHFTIATDLAPTTMFFDEQRSMTGPLLFGVAAVVGAIPTIVSVDQPTTLAFAANPMHAIDLSAIPDLCDEPTVEIRLCAYQATMSGGTWRIDNVRFQ